MSHSVNTRYLEGTQESFFSSKNGFERCALLLELKENGFDREAEMLAEGWYQERLDFLDEAGVEYKDLMQDENDPSVEYWYEYNEMGTPGDDYQVDKEKVELPTYLNVDWWLDYKDIKL